jgi:hypothetical protein
MASMKEDGRRHKIRKPTLSSRCAITPVHSIRVDPIAWFFLGPAPWKAGFETIGTAGIKFN